MQGIHVPVELIDIFVCQRLGFHTDLGCTAYDLVVDVRKISHVYDIITLGLQISGNHVEYHHRPCMPDMAGIINRGSTYVHEHLFRLNGSEQFFLFG